MKICVDDLIGPEIEAFLEEHLNDMKAISPPESKHALDLDGLRKQEITFWTIWDEEVLAGCGALRQLDSYHGEIKSMRTAVSYRGRGVASNMLWHIINEARRRHYQRLSLETGSMEFFSPAIRLYEKHGFQRGAPFANYKEDPNSCFLTLNL